MNEISITHILFLSTALFFIGVYGLLTRRNMITMLMAVELILNSVNINFEIGRASCRERVYTIV